MSGRTKRYVLIAWAALVVLGSGATLVLEREPPPVVGVYGDGSPGPEPAVSRSPTDAEPACPPPTPGPDHDPGDPILWACVSEVPPDRHSLSGTPRPGGPTHEHPTGGS